MAEDQNLQIPNETPDPQEPVVPEDSGLDTDELKGMISNLQKQVESLTAELQRKEPQAVDRSKEVDEYFLSLLKGGR